MSSWRIIVAFRDKGDDGSNEHASNIFRDLPCGFANDIVVLANDHVRAILFKASGRDDDRRVSRLDRVADVDPCHVFDCDPRRVTVPSSAGSEARS